MAGYHLPGDPYYPEEEPEEMLDSEDQWDEEESDDEPEVINPRHPIRKHHAPPPEPSFQIYRHPGGPLWMRTPRKRVLPIHRPLLIEEPPQDPTPECAERLRQWSREQGLIPPYGRATSSQVLDVGAATEVTTARLRRLDEAHDRTSERVDSLEEDGRTTMGMFRETFTRLQEAEERLRDVEQRAEEAVREAADLRAQVAALRADRGSSSS
ncbi:hypothetical protein L2E82_31030 [Cichorium intybus]|uniref:Uncharacterized protein n=1 Tax=Cichorium intybus TaxID=13427 RepID=A0ACB9D2P6_CICIN|nr:hypothetical protein L2E82_31030 [Cichorium intybus]